jgi:hypothetical protein
MPSTDVQQIQSVMQNMMSHGIFDAEVIAAQFRTQGWKFVRDPDLDEPDLSGGKYLIRTPEGREGLISWFTAETVEQMVANAGFFMEGKAPRALILAWTFAQEMGLLLFAVDVKQAVGENPGPIFRTVYEWLEAANGGNENNGSLEGRIETGTENGIETELET